MSGLISQFMDTTLWLSLLADNTSSAYRTGLIVGRVLGVVAILALLAFCIFAIVKAFTKRTTGWIIAGSVSGVLFAILGVCVTVGFVRGLAQGYQSVRERSVASSIPSEYVTGQVTSYGMEKPTGWVLKRKEGAYDVVLSDNSGYVGIIAEEADMGGSENVAQFARKRIASIGADVVLGENQAMAIDGHNWVAFTVKCKVENMPFAYQYYVYSGKEGTYQIMGWTFQNLWEREEVAIHRVMQSFRFHSPTAPAQKEP